ncbi:hypothetical protein IM793_14810 [Pedobacter sp. MR2016-19]|uniref:hypothetical protein n=1 Tax=Pedobacter sp. MR2016-19 TaxID=2780089 RepID=UPI001875B621|nr:hypothetical protein [Pedobacter sp. MR2016-19]MBE5320434.1 hypothetical protein [Pedobacter sp. MR2016-19]
MKKEVSDFVAQLKEKAKNRNVISDNKVEEPAVKYGTKFSDLLLNSPVFSETQIQKIDEARKSINEWRTK